MQTQTKDTNMESTIKIDKFTFETQEDANSSPCLKLNAEFTLHAPPNSQIAIMNSGIIKDVLVKVLKQTVILTGTAVQNTTQDTKETAK